MRYISEPGDSLEQIAFKQGKVGEGAAALDANRDALLGALLLRMPLPVGTVLELPDEWDPNSQASQRASSRSSSSSQGQSNTP